MGRFVVPWTGYIVWWNPRREDVALLAHRRRNCRPVGSSDDPLLSAARVDADVPPTNGPEIFLQTDLLPRYRDRSPIYTRHHDAERGHIAASSLRTSITPGSLTLAYPNHHLCQKAVSRPCIGLLPGRRPSANWFGPWLGASLRFASGTSHA